VFKSAVSLRSVYLPISSVLVLSYTQAKTINYMSPTNTRKPQPVRDMASSHQLPITNRVRTNTEDLHACNIPPATYEILIAKTNWLRAGSKHVKIKDVLDDILKPFLEMTDQDFSTWLKQVEPLLVSHPGRYLGWERVYINPKIYQEIKNKLVRHGAIDDRDRVGSTNKGVFPSVVISAAIIADYSQEMPTAI
jgi:hypothetical protein